MVTSNYDRHSTSAARDVWLARRAAIDSSQRRKSERFDGRPTIVSLGNVMRTLEGSYKALRAFHGSEAETWWSVARQCSSVPPPLAALLQGRTRIEVSAEEADACLAWAERLDGWAEANPKPLLVHPD